MSTDDDRRPSRRTTIDLRLHLLDRQIHDRDGVPLGVVDDVEIEMSDDGPPRVSALLTGRALFYRLIGGGPHVSELDRIPFDRVRSIDVRVAIDDSQESLELAWPERWVRDPIVGRIPGSGKR
ncbi:PRC-barrel domain-containing protein [Gordonia terrae]